MIFTTKSVSAEFDNAQNALLQSSATTGQYDGRINDDDGLEALGGESMLIRSDRSHYTKLVLVAEYHLSGTVTGLARVKMQKSKSGGDALLLAFRDAKLSMVEWDPELHSIYNTSIHYYEQDELQKVPWSAPLSDYVNYLAADPGSRCAALKFGARSLAILQFSHADEDIEMDDWDEELDGPRPEKEPSTTLVNGASSNEDTPYSSSFVLRLSNLDPSLIHPVHLAFLHEYREPTFGILSSTMAPSAVLGRKDHLSYMVFTLDLNQKASTTILSVNGLPQDLFRVMALPAPVGGALLVGTNELIHIDQSGKSHGVGVNHYARQTTSFNLMDQYDLGLKLEGCEIEVLSPESGELLLVLSDGRIGIITFRIDGRTVSGLDVRMVPSEAGSSIITSSVSTLSRLGKGCVFFGSEDCDSLVVGWTRKTSQASKKKNRVFDETLDLDMEDEDFDDLDDDDLYGGESTRLNQPYTPGASGVKTGELIFKVHDRLVSIAPIRDVAVGQNAPLPGDEDQSDLNDIKSELSLVCATGRGKAGAISIINREIQPKVIGKFEFPEARGFWTLAAQKPIPKVLQGDKGASSVGGDYDITTKYDMFMIVSKVDLDGYETSDVYALTGAGFEALTGTEFDPAAGFTIEAGTMGNSMRVIQVLKAEVRCYDGDFGLSQILPMLDEETGAEPRVVSASICDPFLLLVREDSSVCIVTIDNNLELEELEKEHTALLSTKWLTGCLYEDTTGMFTQVPSDKGAKSGDNIVMFLLSGTGALHVYALPDLSKPVYAAEGLSYVPPILSAGYAARRGSAKDVLKEILVADLGDAMSSSPFLLVRHANDDLTIYQPFRAPTEGSGDLSKSLRFQKVTNDCRAKSSVEVSDDEADDQTEQQLRMIPMRRCADVSGYKTVFLPGTSPSFIIKSSKTMPKVVCLQGAGVRGMCSFHTEGCERGFIYADTNGTARVTQIPTENTTYADIGMSLKKLPLHIDVDSITYHPPSRTYVVGCGTSEDFELPKEDDYHKEWQLEKELLLKPRVERGLIKLINPSNWSVIDTVELDACEAIMCVETLNLEVSESTNERKHLIVVGTAISRGEDLPIKGRVIVYDIVTVIPKPGRPETNKRLKLVAKEDIPRGAVTALSEIGTQGLMLVAQGQKCMVRGLKEDGSLLPVAFMDMSCFVTAVRELKGTGLCLMADAVKGVRFTGYTEEPYRMIPFGKSSTSLEALTVDFLPDGNEMSIVACDSDGGIHILQYDPEHPKSLGGHLLLHRTTFSTGAHLPTRTLLLPRTLPPDHELMAAQVELNGNSTDGHASQQQILLLASPTGVIATLTPLAEQEYRRLSSLASQLSTSLPHFGGLNPKAYRAPTSTGAVGRNPPGVDAGVGRSIIDGAVLARWNELGAGRRAEIAGRVGFSDVDEVRATLDAVLGASGLGYL